MLDVDDAFNWKRCNWANCKSNAQTVSEVAYYAWLNAGKPQGRDLEFWCQAERTVMGGTSDECYQEMVRMYKEFHNRHERIEQNVHRNTSSI